MATNDNISKGEFMTLEAKVDDIAKLVTAHETRFAVRAESDKRIDDKFGHLETKIDTHALNQSAQLSAQATAQTALKNALLKVAYSFIIGSATIIIGGVGFVLTGVVKIG